MFDVDAVPQSWMPKSRWFEDGFVEKEIVG
jgi:hypothetical protein